MTNLLLDKEVAARLRCSTRTVRRLRGSGKLVSASGRPAKTRAEEVEAYLKRLEHRKTKADMTVKTDNDVAALARQIALRDHRRAK